MKYALRTLLRAPGFAAASILTLALGIGASTAIFSVVDAVILRPLPYPESSRLVMVWDNLKNLGVEHLGLTKDIYRAYSSENVFEKTAAYLPLDRNLNGKEITERLPAIMATPELLELLGAKPEAGRLFTASDSPDSAVISHSLFLREFAGDPSAIGKSFRLDDANATVIGVLPASFNFGSRATPTDIFTLL